MEGRRRRRERAGRGRLSLLDGFRQMSPAGRVLVVNQFGVNLGFFMVVPFLATYLTDDIGLAATLVGLVMGLRVLSQQGLFLVGGSLADRWGPRPVIIGGCLVRVIAFGMFAATASAPWVVAATVLTGVAGALFNPAVRAYLVHESPGRTAEAFSVFTAIGNLGSLVGPLLGSALLVVDFRLVALVACAVFAVLTAAQVAVLPRRRRPARDGTVRADTRDLVRNRRFWLFALVASPQVALLTQLYLLHPLEATRVTGRPAAVGVVVLVATVVGIAVQMPLLAWCRAHVSPGGATALGLAVMAAGFVPMAVAAPWQPTAGTQLPVATSLLVLLPVLAGAGLLTAGIAIAQPFVMEVLPAIGAPRLVGTYFGAFSLVSALVATGLSTGIGALQEVDGTWARTLPFALSAVVGVVGAVGVGLMTRRGSLDPR